MLKPSSRHEEAWSWGKPSQTRKDSEVRLRSRRFKVQRKKVIDGIAQIQVSKSEMDEMDKGWMKWMKMDKMDAMDSGQSKQEHRILAVTSSEYKKEGAALRPHQLNYKRPSSL